MTRHLIETAAVAAAAVVVSYAVSWALTRRGGDAYARHYVRRAVHFTAFLVALVAVGFVWRVYGSRAGLGFGFLAAGLAFALQEVIGAVAGWFNILVGGIYRIGDRVEIAGVRGGVIDITPLRTKLLETGVSEPPPTGVPASTDFWVHGRQPTGRLVVVSNKATFDEPVFNYSAMWEFVWQEVMFPINYRDDWKQAERIIDEEVRGISATDEAQQAMHEMQQRLPGPAQRARAACLRAHDGQLHGAVGALRRSRAHVADGGERHHPPHPRASRRGRHPDLVDDAGGHRHLR